MTGDPALVEHCRTQNYLCLGIKFDVILHHVLNLVNLHVHKLYKMLYEQISDCDFYESISTTTPFMDT